MAKQLTLGFGFCSSHVGSQFFSLSPASSICADSTGPVWDSLSPPFSLKNNIKKKNLNGAYTFVCIFYL